MSCCLIQEMLDHLHLFLNSRNCNPFLFLFIIIRFDRDPHSIKIRTIRYEFGTQFSHTSRRIELSNLYSLAILNNFSGNGGFDESNTLFLS